MNIKRKLKIGNRGSYPSADQIRAAMKELLELQDCVFLRGDLEKNFFALAIINGWMSLLMSDDVNLLLMSRFRECYLWLKHEYIVELSKIRGTRAVLRPS
jgi:hypothetical protein